MLVEMLLLVLIAAAVFAYVLTPLVRPERDVEEMEEFGDAAVEEQREPVASDGQPVRDLP